MSEQTAEHDVLTEAERAGLRRDILNRYYLRGINTNETGLSATVEAACDVFASRLDAVRRKAGDERAEKIAQAIEALAEEYETAADAAIQDGMKVTDREIQFALNVVTDLRGLIARESR